MDFEKKYPLTQQPGEFVLVQWTRGYKLVELYFNEQLLGSVQGAAKLKTGTTISNTLIGNIDLKLSEKPILLDVIVDGYHSPVNVSHPIRELKGTATFFWIIAAFSIIAGGIEIGIMSDWNLGFKITVILNMSILVAYIVSAVYISKGKVWAYYLGFTVFAFSTLLELVILYQGLFIGWLLYMFELFRFAALGVLIYNFKIALAVRKHARYGKSQMPDLLDSKII